MRWATEGGSVRTGAPEVHVIEKVVVMKIYWLFFAAAVTALCNVANAPGALSCGTPGQFGGCLAHGQFEGTMIQDVAGPGVRLHRDTKRDGSAHWYNPLKRTSRAPRG
jgi:hypothetical protein